MEKITLNQLLDRGVIDELFIHSLENCLYVVRARVGECHYKVCRSMGRSYSHRSLEAIKEDFQNADVKAMWLVQQSAYDEMVGQPGKSASNQMMVPLQVKPAGYELIKPRSHRA